MSENTIVTLSSLKFEDQLSELLQSGARKLIATAVESELSEFLAEHATRRDERGRRGVVRNGYQPERSVLSWVGPVKVKIPKARDRSGAGIGFPSSFVPPYLKKTRRVEEVIPLLYLSGVATNDFDGALKTLLGESVEGLSANSIARLKRAWEDEYEV